MNNEKTGHGMKPIVVDNKKFSVDLIAEASMAPVVDAKREFRFCRIFENPSLFPDDALKGLGRLMEKTDQGEDHPDLPAGYTYLGQFIDHDITFDKTGKIPDRQLDVREIEQGRSPVLDLDSLYGRGPHGSPEQYQDDKMKLKVGMTTPVNDIEAFPNDLPRNEEGKALIGDPRNDENLAVAQTHLAFIKFHNKVVDLLNIPGSTVTKFKVARALVTRHYQWIVLNDFLPRIVDEGILQEVLDNGPKFFKTPKGEPPCMPVEFSVAAYRLGHSMIRDEYEWNRIFNSEGQGDIATLSNLFDFSGVSGKIQTLPSNWIIDWTRFYDFNEIDGIDNNPRSNSSHLIDTRLAGELKNLPEFENENPDFQSLAIRNLLLGNRLGLPSGQMIAEKMNVVVLSPGKIADVKHAHSSFLKQHRLDIQTPLWYYILREAEVLGDNGKRLGPVGSRLLVETFYELIRGSQISILDGSGWTPDLEPAEQGKFTMPDLLKLIDDLNPLG